MLTVLNVVGTRPEAIKMAPVIEELRRRADRVRSIVCVTGQHRGMLDQVLALFHIEPDFDLDVMRRNQSLAGLTASLFALLDPVVEESQPDWILAQGDTTTVVVAALVAYYRRIHFGHVEAGLRTGDRFNPFPEEVNRRVADLVSTACFAPTERARQMLIDEGVPNDSVSVTGNTVVDALLDVTKRPYNWSTGPLAELPPDRRLVLVTAHRRESFGEPFRELCLAIRDIATAYSDAGVLIVYPVHLNPNVLAPVRAILSGLSNVKLIPPLDYLSLVHLMMASELILTDSGGIQEEAPSFGVPLLVMRNSTERPEGIEAGVARLVGTGRARIVSEASRQLSTPVDRSERQVYPNPYGDGRAARRIVSVVIDGSCPQFVAPNGRPE